MMVFDLADMLKRVTIPVLLLVPIDATDWGTNAPNSIPYAPAIANAGKYFCPDNVAHCLYFRQPVYPGGGHAQLAPGNTHTVFRAQDRLEPHVLLPVTPDIQRKVLAAVKEVTQ